MPCDSESTKYTGRPDHSRERRSGASVCTWTDDSREGTCNCTDFTGYAEAVAAGGGEMSYAGCEDADGGVDDMSGQ